MNFDVRAKYYNYYRKADIRLTKKVIELLDMEPNSCLLIKQLSVTSNSYICSGHARIGTNAKEHKVFASES